MPNRSRSSAMPRRLPVGANHDARVHRGKGAIGEMMTSAGRYLRAAAPALGMLVLGSCLTPSQELALGEQQHPEVLKEMGGAYDEGPIGAYVAMVGGRLAANSDLPTLDYTFTVLDTPIVNAMALPGGYVYVTRGLLALANSEAELAGVLGHEIGHVTAHHTAERYNRATLAGILSAGLGVATGSSALGQAAQQGSQMYLLKFSREQENEADALGVKYIARTGYDPTAEADFLHSLDRESQLAARLAGQNADQTSAFSSTHPLTADRVARARTLADRTQIDPKSRPRRRDEFLNAVDGILYGDDPKEGLIRGQTFSHPVQKFTFTVPQGFTLVNGSQQVGARDKSGNVVVFDSDKEDTGMSMTRYLQAKVGSQVVLRDVEAVTINGFPAATGWARVAAQNASADYRLVMIRFDASTVYRFQILTRTEDTQTLGEPLRRMTYSFRRISDAEAAALKPYRVRVVTVKPGDTVQSLAATMPFETANTDRFLVLNGLEAGVRLTPGERVKVVREE
jgi:predicted Zn-dependent protease